MTEKATRDFIACEETTGSYMEKKYKLKREKAVGKPNKWSLWNSQLEPEQIAHKSNNEKHNEKAYFTSFVFEKPWLTEQRDIRAFHQDKLSQGRLPELAHRIGQSAQTEKFL